MTCDLRIILCLTALVLPTTSLAKAEPKARPDLAKQLRMEWQYVQHTKNALICNPDVEPTGKSGTHEVLTLTCQVRVLDPNHILGICGYVTVSAIDPNTVMREQPGHRSGMMMRYEPLRYDTRPKMPSPPSKWQTMTRSLLRLPQNTPSGPEWVTELRPSTVQIELNSLTLGSSVQEIRRVQGTYHVLAAEAMEAVEIPFEPNDRWFAITQDMEVRLKEARSTDTSYNYDIETRDPLGGNRGQWWDLSVGQALPNRIVVEQQFIGEDGEPTRYGAHSRSRSEGGNWTHSGSGHGKVTKIRYLIAVRPYHLEVPFQLERIPLPKP